MRGGRKGRFDCTSVNVNSIHAHKLFEKRRKIHKSIHKMKVVSESYLLYFVTRIYKATTLQKLSKTFRQKISHEEC